MIFSFGVMIAYGSDKVMFDTFIGIFVICILLLFGMYLVGSKSTSYDQKHDQLMLFLKTRNMMFGFVIFSLPFWMRMLEGSGEMIVTILSVIFGVIAVFFRQFAMRVDNAATLKTSRMPFNANVI
jgi:hypothetical protein